MLPVGGGGLGTEAPPGVTCCTPTFDPRSSVPKTNGKERGHGLKRGDEELDEIIEEFEELDNQRAAAHTVERVKTDGQGADSIQDMSPTTTELRRQLLDKVMTADQRELARTLGILTQAEEYDAQHSMTVTMDGECGEEVLIGETDTWRDMEVQVTLDSGCCKHVLPADAAPGYDIVDSPGSRQGRNFVVGNGETVPNEGQVRHNLATGTDPGAEVMNSTFQVAELNRPLMSVSQICSHGHKCVFERGQAPIIAENGDTLARFE